MKPTDSIIEFEVRENGVSHYISTSAHAYHNLMQLLNDRIYLNDFGECKGMGRCGTCLVRAVIQPTILTQEYRNHKTTLSKMGYQEEDVFLSCQLAIDEHLHGCRFDVI